jgi:hypothetical protein
VPNVGKEKRTLWTSELSVAHQLVLFLLGIVAATFFEFILEFQKRTPSEGRRRAADN